MVPIDPHDNEVKYLDVVLRYYAKQAITNNTDPLMASWTSASIRDAGVDIIKAEPYLIEWGFMSYLMLVVDKLVKDEYLVKRGDGIHYAITFDGKLFADRGGYASRYAGELIERQNAEAQRQGTKEYSQKLETLQSHQTEMAEKTTEYTGRSLWVNVCIAIATAVAAVYYLQEILKNRLVFCQPIASIVASFLGGAAVASLIWWSLQLLRKQKKL